MTEIEKLEMLKKENQLLKEQIELYKKLLEEKDKKKEKEYISYPTYPNLCMDPSISCEDSVRSYESFDDIITLCKNGDA